MVSSTKRGGSRLARALYFPVRLDFRVDLGKRHLLLGPPRGHCRKLCWLQPLEHDDIPLGPHGKLAALREASRHDLRQLDVLPWRA